jgi:hypothetical protein
MNKVPRIAGYALQEPGFEGCEIMKTDRAWWSDSNKVLETIKARWQGKNLKQCLTAAGVTKKQWRHFAYVHPHFIRLFRDVKWIRKRAILRLPRLPGYPPDPVPPAYSGIEVPQEAWPDGIPRLSVNFEPMKITRPDGTEIHL